MTFGGESEKTGGGTLILGASAKFYDAENDSVGDIPNGATLRIAAGGIGVVSPGALTGVNLKFAQDAGLVVLPESRCMVLSSAPVLEGENLPIGFEMPEGSDSMTVDILSLPASVTFDSSKLSLPRKSGYAISLTTRQVDGNVIYGLSCKKIGFIISVR